MARHFTHRVLGEAVAIGATLLIAAPAWGAARYASPAGGGDCSQASPCGLETAVEGASDGDEVIITPGDYGSPGAPLAAGITAATAIDVHGLAGGSRPRIFSSADSALVIGAGAALRDVELHHSGGINAFDLGGFAERVVVASQAAACTLTSDGALLRDSVCWATQDGPAVRMTAADAMQLPLVKGALRNVTAYSRFGDGIRITAGNFAQLVLQTTNVIARGGFSDVRAEVVGSAGDRRAEVNLDHSNYASRLRIGGGQVTAPGAGTNQTASPLLADDPLGDFHQLAGSATIDAGVTDAANGPLDFEGQARAQQGSTDIGADEFPAPAPAPVAPRSNPDRARPVLSGLTVRPRAFAARRGTTISYRLSEAAAVSFTIQRRVSGRRKGKRCVTRRREGRRCFRYIRLSGGFQHAGHPGKNSLRFRGRLGKATLRRARYRLEAVPRDAAGNRGRSIRASFRIRRR
jgi:hypothetical protein